jgi:hypothetical protein
MRIALDKDVLPANTKPFESGLRALARSLFSERFFSLSLFLCSMNHNHAKPSGVGGCGVMGGRALTLNGSRDSFA